VVNGFVAALQEAVTSRNHTEETAVHSLEEEKNWFTSNGKIIETIFMKCRVSLTGIVN
jgi:hypothetical protein